MTRLRKLYALLVVLLSCLSVSTLPTPVTENAANLFNYNCPQNCSCVMPTNANTKFLHAKCSKIDDLLAAENIEPDYPIHSIDLSYLGLTRVTHLFSKLPNLTSINLSHNELHEFGHLGRRIKRLNLKHNRITSSKLSKLPTNLRTLNLQHNDITYLPLDFMQLTQLSNLELSHNDINCSCETLEVRNWIQERHIFMENPVICAYPAETHGLSWLQVKQADICQKEKRTRNKSDEENELMLGDQPLEIVDESQEDEELGKDYLPIQMKLSTSKPHEDLVPAVEGSGDAGETHMELNDQTPLAMASAQEHTTILPTLVTDDGDDEGSGSGGGMLYEIPFTHTRLITDNAYEPGSVEAGHKENDEDMKPLEQPTSSDAPASELLNHYNMGIFEGDASSTERQPSTEDSIVPVVHHDLENVVTDETTYNKKEEAEAIMNANVSPKTDNNATYLLMGVISLLVVGLCFFAGIKGCKRRRHFANESQKQTELLEMDKKSLGKPLHRNGTENVPLIHEKTLPEKIIPMNETAKKPYNSNDIKDGVDQHLMNGNSKQNQLPEAQTNEQLPHEYHPITPRYPTPKSPRASKYGPYPPTNAENNNNTMQDNAYLPSSPKSPRYSPVYSPETGRVKIKLTETPRPKTPMLVTRSKSTAGDIITTPLRQSNEQ